MNFQYSEEHEKILTIINHGDSFGNIDDLDPLLYSPEQMYWVARGRGKGQFYQNIDHLDPSTHTADEMRVAVMVF